MNKILLAVAAVVVLLGGFLLLTNNTKNSVTQTQTTTTQPTAAQASPTVNPTEAMMMEEETIVTLTADGFSPSTITVKTGTKVTWTNKTGGPATVDSDPHPVHTLWPFLNLGTFANGSTVSVTFDKAGTYTYHNHLNSSQKGTVVVQ